MREEKSSMQGRMLSFVYSYFENPNMYLRQVEEWNGYPRRVKKNISLYVTDDGSTRYPLRDLKEVPEGMRITRFELTRKVPWNWLACRNLGARMSGSRWLLLTDMDHVVSAKSAGALVRSLSLKLLPPFFIYRFARVDAPDNRKIAPHKDSYLMTRKMFWKIGGYDEELAGNYGTAGLFRERAFKAALWNCHLPVPLTHHTRAVMPDASTTDFKRKEGRDPEAISRILEKKRREGRGDEIKVLSFPYREIE